ncbi:MAG TPA: cysteine peptidase family C39 domain-containing protein [Pirellulales bacterium]|nr:cysteine peptidase family C39 domain-containing protein [Pirellulales bacterium]
MKNELVGVRLALAFAAVVFCGFPAQCLSGEEAAPAAGAQGDFFCGPRCVQQAMRHFGQRVDLYDLVSESRYDGSAAGASMSELREMLARRGIHSLAVELPRRISKPWPGPMIAHLPPKSDGAIGHWVTVTPTDTAGEFSVFYGLRDTRILNWNELIAATSGHALLTSNDRIVPAAVRASWPARRSYAPAVGGCVLLALAVGLLLPKRPSWRRRSAARRAFVLLLAGIAVTICCVFLFPAWSALRVIATSEMADLRGGNSPPDCGYSCYIQGPPEACAVSCYSLTCAEQLCPDNGDCSTELAITIVNANVDTIACSGGYWGKDGYNAKDVTCCSATDCATACTSPDPEGNRWCQLGSGAPVPIWTNEWDDPDPDAPACAITDGRQESPRSRLALIASVNGLGL